MNAIQEEMSDREISERVARICGLVALVMTDETYRQWIAKGVLDINVGFSHEGIGLVVLGHGMPSGPTRLYEALISFEDRDDALEGMERVIDDLATGAFSAYIEGFFEFVAEYDRGLKTGKIVDLHTVRERRKQGTYL